MQQTKSYWRLVAVAGVLSAFVGAACTVTTSTDDGSLAGAAGETSPSAGAAGASTAGAAGATSPGAGAGGATAGAAGTAGAAATPFECDPASGEALGTPNTCMPDGYKDDVCATCVATSCCTEFGACYATSPGNQCGWGGPNNDGEITCAQTCIKQAVKDAGGALEDSAIETCSANCNTAINNMGSKDCGDVIGAQTSDLIGCMNNNCQKECFTG